MLAALRRGARAIRRETVLRLHDRAELAKERVGPFAQRIVDLPRRQLRERPARRRPDHVFDPRGVRIVIRRQHQFDLAAQRAEAVGPRLEVEHPARPTFGVALLGGRMRAHVVAGAQRAERHRDRQRELAVREFHERFAMVEARPQQREILQRIPHDRRRERYA